MIMKNKAYFVNLTKILKKLENKLILPMAEKYS